MVARPTHASFLIIALALTFACNRPNWADPVNAYLSFARAVQKSDVKTAWGALSAESQKLLTERSKEISTASGGSVAEEPAALFFALRPSAPPVKEVKLVKEEGNVAFLSVVPEQGPAQEVRMVREESGWKLDVSGLLRD